LDSVVSTIVVQDIDVPWPGCGQDGSLRARYRDCKTTRLLASSQACSMGAGWGLRSARDSVLPGMWTGLQECNPGVSTAGSCRQTADRWCPCCPVLAACRRAAGQDQ